jgi:D-glycero-alpha-D-manno-heptose-7-phosphate kinase
LIIARSPLRITLGGGGTDLPSYYRDHGGFLIAAAIDKYVYITVHETFVDDLIVKYSKLERVSSADKLEHPIFREALCLLGIHGRALEIASMADIPAGTGLGSSGSFTTALLKALLTHRKQVCQPRELAEQACYIEIERLNEEIGKQDQYISAFGGLTGLEFQRNGHVDVQPVSVSTETLFNLEDNLLLFFTGYSRSASQVLQEQNRRTLDDDQDVVRNLHDLKDLARQSQRALETGDLPCFAQLLTRQWELKKQRTPAASNGRIDEWFELGMANGALGGKLVGAGGGGFLMFYTENQARLRHALFEAGLQEVRFRFDFEGAKVVTQS